MKSSGVNDCHYGRCEWTGKEFSVIDTGGYAMNSDDVFEEIRKQVHPLLLKRQMLFFSLAKLEQELRILTR